MDYIAVLFSIRNSEIDMYEDVSLEAVAASMRKCKCKVLMYRQYEVDIDYRYIEELKPDFIGFSVEYCILGDIEKIAKKCKNILKKVLIFVENEYVTYNYELILRKIPFIDLAILGRGENIIQNVVEVLRKNGTLDSVGGIAYRNENRVIKTKERESNSKLDDLPFIARDLISGDRKTATIFSSKGCSGNCTFCKKKYFDPIWEGKSPQRFVDEIIKIEEEINPNIYYISDCSFEDPDIDGNRIKEICRRIINNSLDIYYCTSFRADFYKKVSPELSQLLLQSGLIAALIGIESGNNDDLKLYNKYAKVENNWKVIDYFKSIGVLVIPSFISFNPFSTREKLQQNLIFLRGIRQCIRFITFLDVLEYTPMFKIVCDADLLVPKKIEEGNYSYNYFMEDNSVYQYKFQKKEIEILANYLKKMIIVLNKEFSNAFDDYLFYIEKHMMQMKHIWRKALKYNLLNIARTVEVHFEEMEVINNKLDMLLYAFFQELLFISHDDISERKIESIANKYDIYHIFARMVDALGKERLKVIHTLYKMDNSLINQWI